jgi:hypothetical protein
MAAPAFFISTTIFCLRRPAAPTIHTNHPRSTTAMNHRSTLLFLGLAQLALLPASASERWSPERGNAWCRGDRKEITFIKSIPSRSSSCSAKEAK